MRAAVILLALTAAAIPCAVRIVHHIRSGLRWRNWPVADPARAVLALTDTLCMTFHALAATTVEEAEAELVEPEPDSMYSSGNLIKHNAPEVLT